jgi:hypothetical protein
MEAFIKALFTWVLPALVVLSGLYFAVRTPILRDADSKSRLDFTKVPYSFARTQLLWWSMIILSCFCAYYGQHGLIFDLVANDDYTYLILMGISLGTTTAAKIIDNTDMAQHLTRHQDTNNSNSFLTDILSDENGVSVHRFQALAFNLIFGLMFVSHFLQKGLFLELGGFELSLMGISSAAYIGLKMNENTPGKPKPDPKDLPAGHEDDLMDIDESYHTNSGVVEHN